MISYSFYSVIRPNIRTEYMVFANIRKIPSPESNKQTLNSLLFESLNFGSLLGRPVRVIVVVVVVVVVVLYMKRSNMIRIEHYCVPQTGIMYKLYSFFISLYLSFYSLVIYM